MSDELELITLPGGHQVKTGLLLPPEGLTLAGEVPEVPDDYIWDPKQIEKALKENNYRQRRKIFRQWQINQSEIGQCCATATEGAMYRICWKHGRKHVPLCSNHLYWKLNGGVDQGLPLIYAYREMQSRGIGPRMVTVGGRQVTIPHDVYHRDQVSAAIRAELDKQALRFRGWECFVLPKDRNKAKMITATACAKVDPMVMAWHVKRGLSERLRGEYAQPGRGVGNHANFEDGGKWVGGADLVHVNVDNSWGPTADPIYGPTQGGWGDNGYALFTMDDFLACLPYHDYWLFTSPNVDSEDPDLALAV